MFVIPGYAMLFALGLTRVLGRAERLFLSLSLSIAIIPFIGLLLDFIYAITPATLLLATLLTAAFFAVIGYVRFFLLRDGFSRSRITYKPVRHTLVEYFTALRIRFKQPFKQVALILTFTLAIFLAILNWQSGLGVHSVDLGVHVFWAKTIQMSGHIPDYTIIKSIDEPYKFVFGSHLLLAEFFSITGLSIETFYWSPLLLLSMSTLLAIFVMAKKVSGSAYAGVIAAILFATAFNPGAYVQRGNLPDIVGYFLFISMLYLLILVIDLGNVALGPIGLVILSIVYYHQYGFLIAASTTLVFLIYLSIIRTKEFMRLLRAMFSSRSGVGFWLLMAILITITALKLQYVLLVAQKFLSSNSYSVQWQSWVIPLYRYPSQLGTVTVLLGLAGILICIFRQKPSHLILLSWISSLLILAHAPLLGLGVPEPYRFVWRMTEPMSILAGIGAYIPLYIVFQTQNLKVRWGKHTQYLPFKPLKRIIGLLAVAAIFLIGFQVFGSINVTHNEVREPFFETNKEVGGWLAKNSDSQDVIAVNIDVDNTATWIRVFSMKTYFLYKVDFGTEIAPADYRKIYQDMATMFDYPSSPEVPAILERYRISFVVAHKPDVPKFESSPFFTRAYQASEAVVYMSIWHSTH